MQYSKYKPLGAYIGKGDLTEGFLRYRFGGLIFGGAYFRNFTVFGFALVKSSYSNLLLPFLLMPDDTSDRRGSSEITGFYDFMVFKKQTEKYNNSLTE